MTLAVPGPASLAFTSRAPSIVIVGADALLAALPATPVQLAHACIRAGFQHVVPASWGDELVAGGVLRELDARGAQPMVQCTCPLVAHRLLSVGTDLGPFLVTLAPPPVALARYLRALYGAARLRITYAGRCPGADDDIIDARLTPDELLALFDEQHIVVEEQPLVFDSVIPPDRRRHISEPGGVPSAEVLWTSSGARRLVEITEGDLTVELAQLLLTERNVLVDPAPLLGCACSGAASGNRPALARERVAALEPPRSPSPIVDSRVAISLTPSVPSKARSFTESMPSDTPPPMPASALATPSAPAEVSAVAMDAVLVTPSAAAEPEDVAPVPAVEVEVTSSEPAVVPTDAPSPTTSRDAFDAAPLDASEAAIEAIAPDSADEMPDGATMQSEPEEPSIEVPPAGHAHSNDAVSNDATSNDEASLTEPLARAPRRTAPFGVMRSVVGETPMTRDSSGRQLPRAYVLRRRGSPRSTPALVTSEFASEAPADAIDLAPTLATPAFGAAPATATATASVVEMVPLEFTPPPQPRDSEREVSIPASEGPRDGERAVSLPVEPHSDVAPARPSAHRAAAPRIRLLTEDRSPRRPWFWIVMLVLVTALVSSVAGAAFVTWYSREHPQLSERR